MQPSWQLAPPTVVAAATTTPPGFLFPSTPMSPSTQAGRTTTLPSTSRNGQLQPEKESNVLTNDAGSALDSQHTPPSARRIAAMARERKVLEAGLMFSGLGPAPPAPSINTHCLNCVALRSYVETAKLETAEFKTRSQFFEQQAAKLRSEVGTSLEEAAGLRAQIKELLPAASAEHVEEGGSQHGGNETLRRSLIFDGCAPAGAHEGAQHSSSASSSAPAIAQQQHHSLVAPTAQPTKPCEACSDLITENQLMRRKVAALEALTSTLQSNLASREAEVEGLKQELLHQSPDNLPSASPRVKFNSGNLKSIHINAAVSPGRPSSTVATAAVDADAPALASGPVHARTTAKPKETVSAARASTAAKKDTAAEAANDSSESKQLLEKVAVLTAEVERAHRHRESLAEEKERSETARASLRERLKQANDEVESLRRLTTSIMQQQQQQLQTPAQQAGEPSFPSPPHHISSSPSVSSARSASGTSSSSSAGVQALRSRVGSTESTAGAVVQRQTSRRGSIGDDGLGPSFPFPHNPHGNHRHNYQPNSSPSFIPAAPQTQGLASGHNVSSSHSGASSYRSFSANTVVTRFGNRAQSSGQ